MTYVLILSTLLTISQSYAELLVYEGFDYSGTSLDTQNGGVGFSDAWVAPGIELGPNNLSVPSGYNFTPLGVCVQADTIGGNTLTRTLSVEIDFDPINDRVYYISMLFDRDDNFDNSAGEYATLMGFKDVQDVNALWLQIESDETMRIDFNHETKESLIKFDPNITYLYVVKIEASSYKIDKIFAKIYKTGQDTIQGEPLCWDVYSECDYAGSLKSIYSNFGSQITAFSIDEIRIGTAWSDVVNTQNPETAPASLPVTDNLIVHLNGDNIQSVYDDVNDVNIVIRMTDISGNANHAEQNEPSLRPILLSEAANGYPAVSFTCSGEENRALLINSNDANFLGTTYTWFIVYRPADTSSYNFLLSSGYDARTDSIAPYWEEFRQKDVWGSLHDSNRILSHSRSAVLPKDAAIGNWVGEKSEYGDGGLGWNLVVGVWDADVAVDSDVDQYINPLASVACIVDSKSTIKGTEVDPGDLAGSPVLESHWGTVVGTRFASEPSTTVEYEQTFGGEIAEIIIYSDGLTINEISQVSTYLKAKYDYGKSYRLSSPGDCMRRVFSGNAYLTDVNFDCSVSFEDYASVASKWLMNY
jgi:hypothetical protein